MNASPSAHRHTTRFLPLSIIVCSLALAGCSSLQDSLSKSDPKTIPPIAQESGELVSPIFGPNVAAIAALIAAIAGGILTVDKTFEKLSAIPPTVSPSLITPKSVGD